MIEYVIVGNVVAYAPVAQLDRVTGYEPVGRGFESLPAHHVPIVLDFRDFLFGIL